MAITDSSGKRNQILIAGTALLSIALLISWWVFSSRPPQIGSDEEVFKAVDSLFTAVTSRNQDLVTQAEKRLVSLNQSGKLPAEPFAYLDGIIKEVQQGEWQTSAEKLYGFMLKQERSDRQIPTTTDRPAKTNDKKTLG